MYIKFFFIYTTYSYNKKSKEYIVLIIRKDKFSIWLDDPHLTNEHRPQDCIAKLTRPILHIASLAAHTTLHLLNEMYIYRKSLLRVFIVFCCAV